MGEDIGKLGGVFRVTDGLQKDFGEARVIDTPFAESGILGTAVGLAMRGYRPVVEIQFDGFVYPAFDQIVTQVAKHTPARAARTPMPITIRIPYGGGIGAVEHHSESPEALLRAHRGAAVMTPSNPPDALRDDPAGDRLPGPGRLLRAQASILGQGRRRHRRRHRLRGSPSQARVRTAGHGRHARCYGPMVRTCLEAATAAEHEGRQLEVIDLRSLSPLDVDTVADSVRRTGRLVVVHEAPVFLGLGAELAARITEQCFYSLEAPVIRVGGYHTPYPPARSRRTTCPTWTASSTASTARWRGEAAMNASSSSCRTSARGSPRPRSCPGTSRPVTPSRSTRPSSRSRRRRPRSSCPARTPVSSRRSSWRPATWCRWARRS